MFFFSTSMAKLDKEPVELQHQKLPEDIALPASAQKFKELRASYHKQAF